MFKNLILVATGLLVSFSAKANIDDNFSLLPNRFETSMKLGETKEFTIKISNEMKTKKMVDYELSLQEFVLTDDGKINATPNTKNPRSLVTYARISNPKVEVLPSSEISVKIIVTVPKDYGHGSGYIVYKLTQDTVAGRKKTKGTVGFFKNLYGFIAINVPEKGSKDIAVDTVTYKNSKLEVAISNKGESFLKTSSRVVVISGEKKIGIFDLVDDKNRKEFLNLPGIQRTVRAIIPDAVLKKYTDLKANVIVSDINSNYIKSQSLDINMNPKDPVKTKVKKANSKTSKKK